MHGNVNILNTTTVNLQMAKVTNYVFSTTILKQKDHIVLHNTGENFKKRKSNRTIRICILNTPGNVKSKMRPPGSYCISVQAVSDLIIRASTRHPEQGTWLFPQIFT